MDFDELRAARHRQRIRAVVSAATVGTVTLIGSLSLGAAPAFADPEPATRSSTLQLGGTKQPSEPLPEREPTAAYPEPIPAPGAEGVTVYGQHSPAARRGQARLARGLADFVARLAPSATIDSYQDQRGAEILGGHAGGAVLRDAQGTGRLAISVGLRLPGGSPAAVRAASTHQARQGPHGEQIEIYTSAVAGRVDYTVHAWSGDTFVEATADNHGGSGAATRPTPFVTVDQLIEIACHPTLHRT
ncbi:hypothetical protein F4553_005183 [Allocatelliglobosispora scoriae]|uniref:Uncharacterized protein n=1 Tax=Allocatelliglobosispora scoriae TaxID=643052 RepID=A0A841BUC8_9ACTN|nr:hypothetical protein [Allocatelliglobosispora scoriae]MBB5871804.1 hypothetical protein [Allocatelliglobosispora scoriae]